MKSTFTCSGLREKLESIKDVGVRKFVAKLLISLLKMRDLDDLQYASTAVMFMDTIHKKISKNPKFRGAALIFLRIVNTFLLREFLSDDEANEARKQLMDVFPEEESGLSKYLAENLGGTIEKIEDNRSYRDTFGIKGLKPIIFFLTANPNIMRLEFFSLLRKDKLFDYEEVFSAVVAFYQKHGYEIMEEEISPGDLMNIFSVTRENEYLQVTVINEGRELTVEVTCQ
jgi:hypothetical protein